MADLGRAVGLLHRRRGDLAHERRGLARARDHLRHQARGAVGHGHVRAGEDVDLLGRGAAALGELAHLRRDHGEAAAMLAGARRLDGGVQRQQVRLMGDLLDDRDALGDRLRRRRRLVHGLADFLGPGGADLGELVQAAGGLGVQHDRGVDVLQVRGRLLDARGLLPRPLRDLVRRRR